MAKYTVEFRELVDSGFNLGLNNYPLYDEAHRDTLNGKIIDHYLFQEINDYVPEKWSLKMAIKMNEIMPLFNKLYESETLVIQPFLDYQRTISKQADKEQTQNKLTETTQNIDNVSGIDNVTSTTAKSTASNVNNASENGSGEQDQTVTQTDSAKVIDIKSDTPQNALLLGDIENSLYASEATVNNSSSDSGNVSVNTSKQQNERLETTASDTESTATNTGNTDTTSITATDANSTEILTNVDVLIETATENGFTQSQVDLLIKWRQSFIDIDMMIVNELKEMFLMVY